MNSLIEALKYAQNAVWILQEEIEKKYTWQELAKFGLKIQAIRKFRNSFPLGSRPDLSYAKTVIEEFQSGQNHA